MVVYPYGGSIFIERIYRFGGLLLGDVASGWFPLKKPVVYLKIDE